MSGPLGATRLPAAAGSRGRGRGFLPRMSRTRFAVWAFAAGAGVAACVDPVDRAAKQRIFSPEEPSAVSKEAQERFDVAKLPADPIRVRRVLRMAAFEATERLGAFRYEADVAFEWKHGTERVKLTEDHRLVIGGLGDFHARVENDRDQAMEVVRVAGRVYGRSKYGRFRVRNRDHGRAEAQRDQAFVALRTFYDLVDGRIALAGGEALEHLGRPARRFLASLADRPPVLPAAELPPPEYPRDGPSAGTARRLKFTDQRSPKSVSGAVRIDEATGVPVRFDLSARIVAPGEKGAEALLTLQIKGGIVAVGDGISVSTPKNPLPDEGRPSGPAAALARFGIRAGPDGGVAPPPPEEGE